MLLLVVGTLLVLVFLAQVSCKVILSFCCMGCIQLKVGQLSLNFRPYGIPPIEAPQRLLVWEGLTLPRVTGSFLFFTSDRRALPHLRLLLSFLCQGFTSGLCCISYAQII